MKAIIYIFILLTSLFSADFEWRSFEEGVKEAKRLNRPILVMISQKDCITCEYMEDVAFEDEELAEYIEDFWVPVKIDIKDAKRYGLKAYGTPTFYFLDSSKKKITRGVVGGANARVFLQKLKEVKNGL